MYFLEAVSAPKINEIKFTKIISIVGSIDASINQSILEFLLKLCQT